MNRAMVTKSPPEKSVRPIDGERLEQLALAYVARFAVSSAKLQGYLRRKLRERGWAGEGEPPVELTSIVKRNSAGKATPSGEGFFCRQWLMAASRSLMCIDSMSCKS